MMTMENGERVCAKCGSNDGVTAFMLSAGAETVALDLCGVHGKPIRKLMELGASTPPGHKGAGSKVTHAVIPVD
jgi:hypothetical protein